MLITKSIFLYNPVFTQVRIFWISCLYIIKIENVKRIKMFTKFGFLSPITLTRWLVDFKFGVYMFYLNGNGRKISELCPEGLVTSIISVILYSTIIIKHFVPKFEIQLFQLRCYEYFLRKCHIGLLLHSIT